ncbi:hypothetical protein QCA50_007435 [Cerrena zonata]|uniref:Uncharacterized protein n=1 Tax=Cerrena zonata TaxID=2478898 RepID=A0AAW0GDN3_9APHY
MPKTRNHKCDSNNDSGDSYYAQHAEARREYQKRYNRIKRATRRKLSKTDLEALQKRKADELDGNLPVFENRVCRRGVGRDPERTDEMEVAERKLVEDFTSRRFTIAEEHSRLSWLVEDDWIESYTKELSMLRDIELSSARTWLYFNSDDKGTHEWKKEVHARRRIVAIYHQEIDLYRQGPEVPLLALQSNELISEGYRVNKMEFRRIYRF